MSYMEHSGGGDDGVADDWSDAVIASAMPVAREALHRALQSLTIDSDHRRRLESMIAPENTLLRVTRIDPRRESLRSDGEEQEPLLQVYDQHTDNSFMTLVLCNSDRPGPGVQTLSYASGEGRWCCSEQERVLEENEGGVMSLPDGTFMKVLSLPGDFLHLLTAGAVPTSMRREVVSFSPKAECQRRVSISIIVRGGMRARFPLSALGKGALRDHLANASGEEFTLGALRSALENPGLYTECIVGPILDALRKKTGGGEAVAPRRPPPVVPPYDTARLLKWAFYGLGERWWHSADREAMERGSTDFNHSHLTYGEVTHGGTFRLLAEVLRLGDAPSGCVFADLGSGFGRIVLHAVLAFTGVAKAVGIELLEERHAIAVRAAERLFGTFFAERRERAQFVCGDILDGDASGWAEEVTHCYFSSLCFPDGVLRLAATKLDRAPALRRVVSLRMLPLRTFELDRRLCGTAELPMSWGNSTCVYIYERVRVHPLYRRTLEDFTAGFPTMTTTSTAIVVFGGGGGPPSPAD